MNIGKDCRHSKYICDKCGKEIPYVYRKGIDVFKYSRTAGKNTNQRKAFDLCRKCEKKLKEWLETKEIDPLEKTSLLSKFKIYEKKLKSSE